MALSAPPLAPAQHRELKPGAVAVQLFAVTDVEEVPGHERGWRRSAPGSLPQVALQLDALATAGSVKVLQDRASGTRTDRRAAAALDYVRDGDVLVTWKLDWLGGSLPP